ncbi:hypothetical protein N9L68_02170 [bacterium]|nr:hypothetical protein [bacterium]
MARRPIRPIEEGTPRKARPHAVCAGAADGRSNKGHVLGSD